MYEAFYGLKERPFNLTPDPRFLYLSEKHKEAFAHLLYGIKNRSGFVMVSGEIGTGKTTICRTLLGQLDDDTEVAFIFNPCLSPEELLRKINEDFGIQSRADSMKGLIDELNAHLLERSARGKNCVLVIDEAQNLSPVVLEQVRLLSNLETETAKLLQIVLIGQPELAQCLELPELRQLNQRITARYHLKALDKSETLQYIAYRLRVAGGRRRVRFSRGAIRAVYKYSKGTPRVINAVCDRALLIGYTMETTDITARMLRRAIREIRGERPAPVKKSTWRAYLPNPTWITVTILVCVTALYLFGPLNVDRNTPGAAPRDISHRLENAAPPMGTVNATAQEKTTPDSLAATAAKSASPLATVLATLDPSVARNAAAMAMLRSWNMALISAYPENDTPENLTAFAAANGLTAETMTPTLEQIKKINLPCFVKVAGDHAPFWMALVGIEGDRVKVTTRDGESATVPQDEFSARYAKQAVFLWRDATPNAPTLKPGMSGPAVQKLQEQLHAAGHLAQTPSGTYDANTAAAVRAMQDAVGLAVDGVAGRQTRMALASVAPSSGPTLTRTLNPAPVAAAVPSPAPVEEPKELPAETASAPVEPAAPAPVPQPAAEKTEAKPADAKPAQEPKLDTPAPAEAKPDAPAPPETKPADVKPAPEPKADAPTPKPAMDAKTDKPVDAAPAVASEAAKSNPPALLAPLPPVNSFPKGYTLGITEEELPPPEGVATLAPSKSAELRKEVTAPAITGEPLIPSAPAKSNENEAKSG